MASYVGNTPTADTFSNKSSKKAMQQQKQTHTQDPVKTTTVRTNS